MIEIFSFATPDGVVGINIFNDSTKLLSAFYLRVFFVYIAERVFALTSKFSVLSYKRKGTRFPLSVSFHC